MLHSKKLIFPLVIEQVLAITVGLADDDGLLGR